MILTCPECKSRYVVNPSALLPRGRTVRCAKCSHSWFEKKPDNDVEVVPPVEETKPSNEAETKETETSKPVENEEQQSNTETSETDASDEDFEFPINRPRKRSRPVPKGSNLPALQNQKYGSNKLGWIGLVVFVTTIICSFMIFQETITEMWPASNKLYTAIGLDGGETTEGPATPETEPIEDRLSIGGVTPSRETINNISHLVIAGHVENISDEIQTIPPIKVVLLDENRRNIREWSFTPNPATVNPAEQVTFETSLPSPPAEARDISVLFSEN